MILEKEKTPYNLYIDESGGIGMYKDKKWQITNDRDKFFTLAGIIVNKDEQKSMEGKTNWVIDHYLNGKPLGKNFKLHYYDLMHKRSPYNQLSSYERRRLTDDVFKIIERWGCTLLSVTIDLEIHYGHYPHPFNPQAYAMILMQERFQSFLEEKNGVGKVIYERFNKKMRKKMERLMVKHKDTLRVVHYKELSNIKGHIENGDPATQAILQLADFFAYVVQIKSISKLKKRDRWESLKHKYFNLDGGGYKAGNVEI